ncbi:putative Digalactosyldiacylglycerol synthase 1, chloroplastic [Cocos nucifera]|nr:putative Digalactosyldiacylglycerol synthase 1, chloroplastic [Cocos nucifera]
MESPQEASSSGTAEKAFSFLSKGWREVRDFAGADLQLMRARASSFKNLADRELENFLQSASAFSAPPRPPVERSIAELDFVKRIQPKLSEIRRAYSSPEFSRKMLEKWSPKSSIRIDLSGIRNAIVAEVDEVGAFLDLGKDGVRCRGSKVPWKELEEGKEWEPIRLLKTRLKERERKSQSSEIFGNFKTSKFVNKVKLILRSMCKEPQESKEVPPPLDLPELLAYLVKQSGPLFDQVGLRRDVYKYMLILKQYGI